MAHKDVGSSRELNLIIQNMLPAFTGKEELMWKTRVQHCITFRRLCLGNSPSSYPDAFLANTRLMIDHIVATAKSLRSTASADACQTLQTLPKIIDFSPFIDFTLPTLIELCGSSKKLDVENGDQTTKVILKHATPNTRFFNNLSLATHSTKATTRACSAGWITVIIKKHGVHCENAGLQVIEPAIRDGLIHADEKVRIATRETFWAFAMVWPERAQSIMSSLDSSRQKLLRDDPHNPQNDVAQSIVQTTQPSEPGPSNTAKKARPNIRQFISKQKALNNAPVDTQPEAFVLNEAGPSTAAQPSSSLDRHKQPQKASHDAESLHSERAISSMDPYKQPQKASYDTELTHSERPTSSLDRHKQPQNASYDAESLYSERPTSSTGRHKQPQKASHSVGSAPSENSISSVVRGKQPQKASYRAESVTSEQSMSSVVRGKQPQKASYSAKSVSSEQSMSSVVRGKQPQKSSHNFEPATSTQSLSSLVRGKQPQKASHSYELGTSEYSASSTAHPTTKEGALGHKRAAKSVSEVQKHPEQDTTRPLSSSSGATDVARSLLSSAPVRRPRYPGAMSTLRSEGPQITESVIQTAIKADKPPTSEATMKASKHQKHDGSNDSEAMQMQESANRNSRTRAPMNAVTTARDAAQRSAVQVRPGSSNEHGPRDARPQTLPHRHMQLGTIAQTHKVLGPVYQIQTLPAPVDQIQPEAGPIVQTNVQPGPVDQTHTQPGSAAQKQNQTGAQGTSHTRERSIELKPLPPVIYHNGEPVRPGHLPSPEPQSAPVLRHRKSLTPEELLAISTMEEKVMIESKGVHARPASPQEEQENIAAGKSTLARWTSSEIAARNASISPRIRDEEHAREQIYEAMDKINNRVMEDEHYRKLQGLVRAHDQIFTGYEMVYSELLLSLCNALVTPNDDKRQPLKRKTDHKFQILVTIGLMKDCNPKYFRELFANVLAALVEARANFDSRTHIVSGLEQMAHDIVALYAPSRPSSPYGTPADAIDSLLDIVEVQHTNDRGNGSVAMGLNIISGLSARNRQMLLPLDEPLKIRMAQFAKKCLREQDTGIRQAVMAYCLEMFKVITPEDEYYRLIAGRDESLLNLLAYYLRRG